QALLKQQCHLASFDGMSAIVGVSSANLQKMTQQKIPNIEAAFAQVCQRKVVVQLEVANSQGNTVKNSIAPINPPIVETATSPPEQPPNPPPPSPLRVPPEERAEIKPPNFPTLNQTNLASVVQASSAKSFNHNSNHNFNGSDYAPSLHSNERTSKDNSTAIHPQNPPVLAEPPTTTDFALENNLNTLATSTVLPLIPSELDIAEEYKDSELQKAIASLTQSFEGEVVQLNNLDSLDRLDMVDNLESIDDLNLKDASFVEEEKEEEEKEEILTPPKIHNYSDRPDVEEYDDEW
ncbi:MAG: hypothetical protein ACRC1Z_03950, partial [Waterburya sp.]